MFKKQFHGETQCTHVLSALSEALRQEGGYVFNEVVIDLCLAGRPPAKYELDKHSGCDLNSLISC